MKVRTVKGEKAVSSLSQSRAFDLDRETSVSVLATFGAADHRLVITADLGQPSHDLTAISASEYYFARVDAVGGEVPVPLVGNRVLQWVV